MGHDQIDTPAPDSRRASMNTDTSTGTGESHFGRDYWEERYGAPGHTWSGNPNPVLVTETSSLTPGRALDIGSGEGGDALWLATRGWQVTGVDIAVNALHKARARAEAVDAAAAARIQWQQHDLTTWSPRPRSYDLVSSQFMHLGEPARSTLFRSLAAALAPGGTLLVVGHDATDLDASEHRLHHPELMFDVDDVLDAIDGEDLHVEVAESRERRADAASTIHDIVVRAVRDIGGHWEPRANVTASGE